MLISSLIEDMVPAIKRLTKELMIKHTNAREMQSSLHSGVMFWLFK